MNEDDVERMLRAALHGEADQIGAGPDDLQRLQHRIATEGEMRRLGIRRAGGRGGSAPRDGRRWMPLLATAASVALVAGLGGAWLAGRPDPADTAAELPAGSVASPGGTSEASGTRTATVTSAATSPTPSTTTRTGTQTNSGPEPQLQRLSAVVSTSTRALPVYWVAPGDRPGYKLYREYYSVPKVDAQAAVDAMLTGRPTDRDYGSPWRPARAKVAVRSDVIVVDLEAAAFADPSVTRDLAEAGLQQLVYTATAGAALQTGRTGSLPVRVLVDGKSGATVWKTVRLDKPLKRDSSAVADVWVTSPVEGSVHKAGKLTVDVFGTAFEATALWEVHRVEDGARRPLRQGYLNIGSMGERAAGRFTVTLTPGEYRIRVYAPDMSDGEAPANPDVPADQTGDDKTIRVR